MSDAKTPPDAASPSKAATGNFEVFREQLDNSPILIDLEASTLDEAVEILAAALLLIGASVLVFPWMKRQQIEIPMAVLFGLFLYMGVTSLGGNQFFERLKLRAMDPVLYPPTHYVRNVPLKTVHIFTALQLAGLAVLWFVKTSAIALIFPLFIALLVPFRLHLARYFKPAHLALLDSEEEVGEEELRETD